MKELIGQNVKIKDSSNPPNIGVEGTIIDETKNTITIRTKKGNKKMIKRQNTFEGKGFLIEGKLLEKRPEERK